MIECFAGAMIFSIPCALVISLMWVYMERSDDDDWDDDVW